MRGEGGYAAGGMLERMKTPLTGTMPLEFFEGVEFSLGIEMNTCRLFQEGWEGSPFRERSPALTE